MKKMKKQLMILMVFFAILLNAQTPVYWRETGNSLSNNAKFIGTLNNTSLRFSATCPGIALFKIDSMVSCGPYIGGWKHFYTFGVPITGELNEFTSDLTNNPTLSGNIYNVRGSLNWASNVNNINYRIASMLGVSDVIAANTGTLGWNVGGYQVAYDHSSSSIARTQRNYGSYVIAANRGNATIADNSGIRIQTECLTGTNSVNRGIWIESPITTTAGVIGETYGLYISDVGPATNQRYAIRTEGVTDPIYFAGPLTANSTLFGGSTGSISTSLQTPLLIGGNALNSSLVLKGTTNTGAAGTGTAISIVVGNNGATQGPMVLNNGNFLLPQNRSILGVDGGGSTRLLLAWQGDNIIINGVPGSSDISINPTSSGAGLVVKSQGRVGINIASPTAFMMLPAAGLTSVSNEPLGFTISGASLVTTPVAGKVEVNSSGTLFYSPANSDRRTVLLSSSAATLTSIVLTDGTSIVRSGSVSQVGAATTAFTVTIGATQANSTYKVNVTPTNLLAAAAFYISSKTTTQFVVTYIAGLTGTVNFDWILAP